MRSALLGAAIALALIAVVIVALRWHYQRGLEQRAAERLPDLQDEAWAAARQCRSVAESAEEVVRNQTGNGTRRSEYVAQGVGARADVCSEAVTKLEIYIEASPTLDAAAIQRLMWAQANARYLEHLQRRLR